MQYTRIEIEYIVKNLQQALQEAIARPECFEPDAVQRIDKALSRLADATTKAA
jgi:hypothetical protein